MSFIELLKDYNVPFQTEGHKHCRPGWINMECPFCTGNPGYHLGWSIQLGYFSCWRCGGKRTLHTIAKIIGIPEGQVKELVRQYRIKRSRPASANAEVTEIKRKKFEYPNGVMPLQWYHMNYLKSRGLDPIKLEKKWGIRGTGPMASLDGIDYRMRIIAPITWEGRVVSFQGRDITNKSSLRYMACPQKREITDHKKVLYRPKELVFSKPVIVTEGIFDVWKLPYQSIGTFGIKYKIEQIKWIAINFKEVIVLFDDDPQAITQSKKMSSELRFSGVYAKSEFIKGDPGSLTDKQAQDLVRSFGLEPEKGE